MRKGIRTTLGMLTTALTALVFVVAPAAAAGNTQISGVGTFETANPPTRCTAFPSVISPIIMTGDLVGCWYTTSSEVVHTTPSGGYRESGTETFDGCLSDGTTCGTFSTTYQFEAKYAANGSEIHGHCEHPLVSGTGDFAGITGQINMKDDVATGEFNYRGHFSLR